MLFTSLICSFIIHFFSPSCCRNLYKHVKLLSVGLEPALPIMPRGDDPLPPDAPLDGLPPPLHSSLGNQHPWPVFSSLSDSVFPTLAFIGMFCVLVFFCHHVCCKGRVVGSKPRGRRKTRLRGKIQPFSTYGNI